MVVVSVVFVDCLRVPRRRATAPTTVRLVKVDVANILLVFCLQYKYVFLISVWLWIGVFYFCFWPYNTSEWQATLTEARLLRLRVVVYPPQALRREIGTRANVNLRVARCLYLSSCSRRCVRTMDKPRGATTSFTRRSLLVLYAPRPPHTSDTRQTLWIILRTVPSFPWLRGATTELPHDTMS